MKLKNALVSVAAILALGASHVAHAAYAFGASFANPGNALLITTTTGTYTLSNFNPTDGEGSSNDSGFWKYDGFSVEHTAGFRNYLAGEYDGATYNSYMTFGLGADFSGTILSAQLRVNTYLVDGAPLNLSVWDVTSNLFDVRNFATGGPDDLDIFNDLGSGTLFGDSVINASAAFINITLNDAALAALEAGRVAGEIGFGFTVAAGPTPEVPEPGTLALVGLGLLGLATRRKQA